MSLEITISAAVGIITLFLSTLSQVALWQHKEYRWDRLRSHLHSPQGNLTNYPLVLSAIAAILIGWLSYLTGFTGLAEFTGFTSLLLLFLHHALRISRRGIFRPDFTVKAITIITVTLAFQLYIPSSILHIQQLIALQLSTFIFFLPGFTALAVALANILFNFRKKQIIVQAKRLRSANTNMTVVGITGSYGKTSTKHFLEQILTSAGKNIAATKAHHNTPIGIAQDMLTLLPAKPDIFIVELSAYRRGEIKELADIVKPRIGVITAIGNQHLDLFGSPENILSAKWELIDSLPKDGLVVLNADYIRLKQKAAGEFRDIIWYSTKHHADVWVEHLHVAPRQSKFTLHLKDFTQAITLTLASEALLPSALAAAAACLALEIPPEEIVSGLGTLTPFLRTMEVVIGKNGATIIDDSYSSNEQGTLLAIRHLGRFRESDKRVVLLPLIELGADAKAVHRRIGEAVRAAGARLYVAGTAFRNQLGPGIYENNPKKLAQIISQDISDQTVVLLESRLPDVIRKAVFT